MLYAVKGNKQLKIEEAEKDTYLNMGYDIAEADGDGLNTVAVSAAKTVIWKDHQAVVAQSETLKDENEALQKENDAMQKENKSLKEKLAEANKKLKDLGQV